MPPEQQPSTGSNTTEPVLPNQVIEPAVSPPTPAAPVETPAEPAPPAPEPRKRKWLWVSIAVVVVIAAAVSVVYALHRHQQPVATKRDIPLVRYGILAGANLPAPYPGSVNTNAASQVESQLFEGLVAYNNQSDIKPLLATGWTNPDDTHWVFTLRQGVHFHSGRPLTAQAVASSLNYAVAHQKDQDGSLVVSLASTIQKVTARGTNEVTIATNGPDPTLLNRLTGLYIFDPQATPGSADAGTGPYVLQTNTGSQKNAINLKAYDKYWAGHVYTRAISFTPVADQTTATKQVIAGNFDVAGQVTPTKQLTSTPGLRTYRVQDLGPYFIGVNTLKVTSPLHSLAARQAVASALDAAAIIKASDSEGQPASQLIPSAIPGYDPNLHPTPYDLTKAKQLLAGLANSKTPITFTYSKSSVGAGTEITKELTAAGFNVKPQVVDDLDTLVGIALSGKTDLYYLSYTSDTLDGLDILSTLVTGNADYDNPQIDTLVNQAGTTLDPSTRIKQLQKISQLVAVDLPDIPVYFSTFSYVARSQYHLTMDMPNALIGVYFWKVYQ